MDAEPNVSVALELPIPIYAELETWADMVLDEPLEAVLERLTYELATNEELRGFAVRLMTGLLE